MSDFLGLTDKWKTPNRAGFVERTIKSVCWYFCFLSLPTQRIYAQENDSRQNQTGRQKDIGARQN